MTNAERLHEKLDNRYYKKRAGKKFDRPKRQDDEPAPGSPREFIAGNARNVNTRLLSPSPVSLHDS